MIKSILILILNLSLPFLLFALRNWLWRLYLERKGKKDAVSKIPKLDFTRAVTFLGIGIILFLSLILVMRHFEDRPNPREPREDWVVDY